MPLTADAIRIRPLRDTDLDALLALRASAIRHIKHPDYPDSEVRRWAEVDTRERLLAQARQCGVLVALDGEQLLGFASLAFDADSGDPAERHLSLDQLFIDPERKGLGLGRLLLQAAEQRACELGAGHLRVEASLNAVSFYQHHGYRDHGETPAFRCQRANLPAALLEKDLHQQHSVAQQQALASLAELGIDPHYGCDHGLPLVDECQDLVSIGEDVFGREQRMLRGAASAWQGMRNAAAEDDIKLQAVSAFRSVNYQVGLLRRKLDSGQALDQILSVSAAPGYSEHHSGRALDITTPGVKALEEEFENTDAFRWLQAHAGEHGFRLSYPRDNPHGIAYEPWHWYWTGKDS